MVVEFWRRLWRFISVQFRRDASAIQVILPVSSMAAAAIAATAGSTAKTRTRMKASMMMMAKTTQIQVFFPCTRKGWSRLMF